MNERRIVWTCNLIGRMLISSPLLFSNSLKMKVSLWCQISFLVVDYWGCTNGRWADRAEGKTRDYRAICAAGKIHSCISYKALLALSYKMCRLLFSYPSSHESVVLEFSCPCCNNSSAFSICAYLFLVFFGCTVQPFMYVCLCVVFLPYFLPLFSTALVKFVLMQLTLFYTVV